MQGGTFTLATLAIKISKFSLKMNNDVTFRGDVAGAIMVGGSTGVGGIAHAIIGDYNPEISIDPEAALVADYDYFGAYLAGTTAVISLVLTDGTDIVTFTFPKVQYKEIKEGNRGGIQIYDITGQCLPTSDSVDAAVKFVVT